MSSGKLVTIGILALAVLAGGVAWWHTWSKGQRSLEYWGSRRAGQIRLAPKVTFYELGDSGSPASRPQLEIGSGQLRGVIDERDVSLARGLVHARQALIQDSSFNWDEVAASTPQWRFALRFEDRGGSVLVLFDLDHALIASADDVRPLSTNLGPGFAELFSDVR